MEGPQRAGSPPPRGRGPSERDSIAPPGAGNHLPLRSARLAPSSGSSAAPPRSTYSGPVSTARSRAGLGRRRGADLEAGGRRRHLSSACDARASFRRRQERRRGMQRGGRRARSARAARPPSVRKRDSFPFVCMYVSLFVLTLCPLALSACQKKELELRSAPPSCPHAPQRGGVRGEPARCEVRGARSAQRVLFSVLDEYCANMQALNTWPKRRRAVKSAGCRDAPLARSAHSGDP